MDCAQYLDLVAPDIDGALEEPQRSEAQRHVTECARCTALRRGQVAAKTVLRERSRRLGAPSEVKQKVVAAIEREPERGAASRRVSRWRIVIVGAVAAMLVLFFAPLWRSTAPDVLALIVQDVETATAQELPLTLQTTDIEEIRRFYRESKLVDFESTAPDLSPMGYRPVGARISEVNGVSTTLTVYEGPGGKLICRRYRRGAIEMPTGGEKMGEALVFTVREVTVRIVQDGDSTCYLATTMPREEFLRYVAGH
jgi:hypothetical protein